MSKPRYKTLADAQALLQPAISVAAGKTITNVTVASSVVTVTATAHGYSSGNWVIQSGIGGAVEANGAFEITVKTANAYTLNGLAAITAYTSGGSAVKLTISGLLKDLKLSQLESFMEFLATRPDFHVSGRAQDTADESTLGTQLSVL